MSSKSTKVAGALTAAIALVGAMALSGPAAMSASAPTEDDERISGRPDLNAVGITEDDRLIAFETKFPRTVFTIGDVVLADDASVIGIDYRVQNNLLYAVGDEGGIYTVSTDDASTTKVSQLSVELEGELFGVDFNPAADRLRVISDTGQNLRHDVNTDATTVDGTLTYPAVPPGEPTTGVGITAAAYTNNDLDPNTATTLFVIDTNLDQVVLQSPANAGSLAATGKLTVDAETQAGFDIYSRIKDGRAKEVTGFASLSVDGRYRVFKVDLLSGEVRRSRGFPIGDQPVDIALLLNQR